MSFRGPLTGRDGSPQEGAADSSASVLMGYLLVENDDVPIYNDRVFLAVALADDTPVFGLMGFIIVGHNVNYIAVAAVEQGVGVTDGLDIGEYGDIERNLGAILQYHFGNDILVQFFVVKQVAGHGDYRKVGDIIPSDIIQFS